MLRMGASPEYVRIRRSPVPVLPGAGVDTPEEYRRRVERDLRYYGVAGVSREGTGGLQSVDGSV